MHLLNLLRPLYLPPLLPLVLPEIDRIPQKESHSGR
ncbi:unnamed protein product [Spirodela intermedia]|uniref:Uncharacterized protein n=2 Tax=Spirodela intermedia TaxID=51605 RepID=A0A7I8JI29_SPIIN|nr:unnamed protein product [Spirodela intermedia]CAA6669770.1 unnamed protein product [Spirodela intermedia]CAA7406740.1 unnamed protein product [Spirodela intermedia]